MNGGERAARRGTMADDRKPEETPPKVDVTERAGVHTGNPQQLETRLFMQLLVFECEPGLDPAHAVEQVATALSQRKVSAVIYEDVNAPRRLGVLTWSERPDHFVRAVRPALNAASAGLQPCHDYTMLGRTYATGYEPDLRFWLLERPVSTVSNGAWPWAIWYPLKRQGAFNRLEGREQAAILKEHGAIGRAYGEQDLAHDVRLACFGIDTHDNDFVIGLIGKELHPLSHVVQAMRKTRQTAELMEKMGPFFVGFVARRV
jgi:chlorite dismutase